MSLQALRRWIARHPVQWVLGLALGLSLTLSGAQVAAAVHELSHVAAASQVQDPHAVGGHDCPTCLIAAALGGAAPAATAIVLIAPEGTAATSFAVERSFTPRVALAYASRAPPAPAILSA
jgi:hypothetical protein